MKHAILATAALIALTPAAFAGTPDPSAGRAVPVALSDEGLDQVAAGATINNFAYIMGIGSQNACVTRCIGGINFSSGGIFWLR